MVQMASQMFEKLLSQAIINREENGRAITPRSDEELQVSQKK